MKDTLLCLGLSYCAQHLALHVLRAGMKVAGTSRDIETCHHWQGGGVEMHLWDAAAPLPLSFLEKATHLLLSIPPDTDGDPVIRLHEEWLKTQTTLQWVGYLSSTGVYGDHGGAWVDEATICKPATERGKRRLAAERQWLALHESCELPIHVFRLSGIYGPGRSALDDVRAGTARRILKEGHVFSRIHVEDIAAALLASIQKPSPGAVYNVADNLPAPQHEVVEYACNLLGVAPPPLQPLDAVDMSPMARSFYEANRRVSNRKLIDELGVRLTYPDYKKGLEALLASKN